MTITIGWGLLKVVGLLFFILSGIVCINGDLPDHTGSPWANMLRIPVWGITLIIILVFFFRGCIV